MRNRFFPVIALAAACGLIIACGGNGKDGNDMDIDVIIQEPLDILKDVDKLAKEGVKVPRELEEMVNHFRNAGFSIGEYSLKHYELIGASAGFGLEVGGQEIELYYYDPAKTEPSVLDGLKDLHKPEGAMAVVINGYYQLVVALHPEQEKLIKTFMDF